MARRIPFSYMNKDKFELAKVRRKSNAGLSSVPVAKVRALQAMVLWSTWDHSLKRIGKRRNGQFRGMNLKRLTTYTIYGLVDPHTHEVRYVGQTRNTPEARLDNHLLCAKTGVQHPVYDWIRSMSPAKPILVVLQRVEESAQILDSKREHRAHAAEIKWMKRFERFQLLQFVDKKRRAYKRLVNPGE